MKRFEIRTPAWHEMQAFYVEAADEFHSAAHYKASMFVVRGAFLEGRPVAMGGIQKAGGKLWAFLDVIPERYRQPIAMVRAMRRELVALGKGHPIYILKNDAHATSKKLVEHLGFVPTGEVHENMKVYRWQS